MRRVEEGLHAKRTIGRGLFTLGAVAVVACAILAISPPTLGAAPAITLTKPYHGTSYTDSVGSYSGFGCIGTGNSSWAPPYFYTHSGRGGVGQTSNSQPCRAWVYEFHECVADFGLNGSAFSPGAKIAHAKVTFHWTLTYTLLVNTTWGGSNQTSYAYAALSLGAWVYDVTTGTNTGSSSSYYNQTYLYDTTGQIVVNPQRVSASMAVTVTLRPSNRYELRSYVETETAAETDGPVHSTAADTALAQITFSGLGPAALLSSITY